MRRADRLFRIVQMLRSGRVLTGAQLAQKLHISARTLYRDVRDLQLSGMPIVGEPGVGYTLRRHMDMPPLRFTPAEIVSLVLGARMVGGWGGAAMATSANDALRKIEAAVPEEMRFELDTVQMYAPGVSLSAEMRARIDLLHQASAQRHVVDCVYIRLNAAADANGERRRLRPLALLFWGGVWTLVAWCELRDGFRVFRLDRMERVHRTEQTFVSERGQTFHDYLRATLPPEQLRSIGLRPRRGTVKGSVMSNMSTVVAGKR